MEENQQLEPLSKDEKTWAMLCHLSAVAGFVIPFGSILGPLVVWLIKKDEMPIVDLHGKKSLNFQIEFNKSIQSFKTNTKTGTQNFNSKS